MHIGNPENAQQPEQKGEHGKVFTETDVRLAEKRAQREKRFKEKNPYLAKRMESFDRIQKRLEGSGHDTLAKLHALTKPIDRIESRMESVGLKLAQFPARIATLGLCGRPLERSGAVISELGTRAQEMVIGPDKRKTESIVESMTSAG
jgi:hypothetical protein